ncbi:Glutaminyl-peptide cyclotransferase [Holothuria leucospilota]|uniref:Glutaminyl-peptide cyclotransferase n=1 Tax=Holothuria leucospilota TaxID=206669 RepID=A0A9Q1CG01_HOLLE|nr:Glutaminyl-peptide cyclotransferase [Holothuria leucospilota]
MSTSRRSTLLLVLMVFLDVNSGSHWSERKPDWTREWSDHQAHTLTNEELPLITGRTNIDNFYERELRPLLIPRVPGTEGNEAARNHIISRLNSLNMWTIELDKFTDRAPAPHGLTEFVNVVATLRPDIKRRLVLACHYDSKYFAPRQDGKVFIGATDSAVPCAMLLDLASNLADLLQTTTQVSTSLQLIFFDGEEAFVQWTRTDSLYGARHLAAKMENTPHPPGATDTNQLDAMDMFILLDLIGTPDPVFRNMFSATSSWFIHLAGIETRLREMGAIRARSYPYFRTVQAYGGGIEDDHIPFLRRGMDRIMHLIANPFPSVWHKMSDNAEALDPATIDDLNKILQVFVVEYMHLLDSQPS